MGHKNSSYKNCRKATIVQRLIRFYVGRSLVFDSPCNVFFLEIILMVYYYYYYYYANVLKAEM